MSVHRALRSLKPGSGSARWVWAAAGLAWLAAAGPAAAQHAHDHGAAATSEPSTVQTLVFMVVLFVVLRTLRDVIRARPWVRDENVQEYERVRKIRAARQMGALVLGASLGLVLFSVLDTQLHVLSGGRMEDPRIAAARSRVDRANAAMQEQEGATSAPDEMTADDTAPAAPDPEHEGHAHDPGEHAQDVATADASSEVFHRVLFATVGAALFSLLAVFLPIPEAANADG